VPVGAAAPPAHILTDHVQPQDVIPGGSMTDSAPVWSEQDSDIYRSLARYAVPERERQVGIITELVTESSAPGAVLDLCCGEGLLTAALLKALPDTAVLAYDGSPSMLEETRARAAGLPGAADRLTTRQIDLEARDWRRFATPLRAVVSSLAVHHLDGPGKRGLFADLHGALAPGGVFVLADLVLAATPTGREISARLWDEEAQRLSLALDGDLRGYEAFRRADWNCFRGPEDDPVDRPSTLVDHLDWLREAGFVGVDLHWMTAGQMILSGWRR